MEGEVPRQQCTSIVWTSYLSYPLKYRQVKLHKDKYFPYWHYPEQIHSHCTVKVASVENKGWCIFHHYCCPPVTVCAQLLTLLSLESDSSRTITVSKRTGKPGAGQQPRKSGAFVQVLMPEIYSLTIRSRSFVTHPGQQWTSGPSPATHRPREDPLRFKCSTYNL